MKSGKIAKLDLREELFPGDNRLLWRVSSSHTEHSNEDVDSEETLQYAISGVQQFLSRQSSLLSIEEEELFAPYSVKSAIHDNGYGTLIQLSLERRYKDIPVRDSRAFATIKNGNLIMVGLNRWGDIHGLDVRPSVSLEDARDILAEWAEEELVREKDENDDVSRAKEHRFVRDKQQVEWKMEVLDLCTPELQILILDAQDDNDRSHVRRHLKTNKKKNKKNNNNPPAPTFEIGSGYTYALVWKICPKFTNQNQEIMEGLVDAHTGRIYSFVDTVDYFSGVASVYPVSNDGQVPDGVLQSGWPMPYMTVSGDGEAVHTDSGGNYWSIGEKTVTLSGKYVHMNDQCGSSSLIATGDFDWGGVVNGTDCDTPDKGGDGNTQASRSGYYELNRIIEIARSHLPGNGWLKQKLTANMNIPESCNAFWNGDTVNFYRSSGEDSSGKGCMVYFLWLICVLTVFVGP